MSIKKKDPSPISELIASTLLGLNFDVTVSKGTVINAYHHVVGPFLSKLTWHIDYQPESRTLFLRLGSAAMRQEFMFKQANLMESINKRVGGEAVKQIVLQ